jgi:hypothetical protein
MAKEIVFSTELPDKLNLSELNQAVKAVRPEVEVFYDIGRQKTIRDENGNETVESIPPKLVFKNVPENITRRQIKSFIENHLPEKTEEEAREEEDKQRVNSRVKELPVIKELFNRLEILEAATEASGEAKAD